MHKSTFLQICIHPPTCTTSILEDAIFHSMELLILARQSSHVPTWASDSRTSGSRCISHTLPRGRSLRKIRLCRFCTLIRIVSDTAMVSLRTLPVSFPLPTISQTFLFMLFCPLILDHGGLFHNFRFWPQDSSFSNSSRYFFLPLSSICDNHIRSSLLMMNLHIVQFQYGLEFLRLSYS